MKQLSTHFSLDEFKCPCGNCKIVEIDMELVDKLERLRSLLGSKLTITSGYRCQDYQDQLTLRGYETSKGTSQHTLGMAADVMNGIATGQELAGCAVQAGFKAIGVGNNFIHVDLRADKERRWTYVKRVHG